MQKTMLPRWWRGISSAIGTLLLPLGRFGCFGTDNLCTPQRMENGLILLLPGIQGKSNTESSVAKGLDDAEVAMAIEIHDWTTGFWFLFPYHLRASGRNRRAAVRLAARICEYQRDYPGRPVHLIGHSGGAGLSLLALESLPDDVNVTSAILLAAAVSPTYDLQPALNHVNIGIWNFCSRVDLLFLFAATLLLGTFDGRHTWAAGLAGFMTKPENDQDQKLRHCPFTLAMLPSWNYAGHFGCTNRVFVTEWIAPLLTSCDLLSVEID